MKALTLQLTTVASGEQQQASCGRSLTSNYAPLNLENKILTQSSTMKPLTCSPMLNLAASPSACPSLQPSRLSSTKSSLLLSPASFTCTSSSPLLSTENKLLTSDSSFPKSSLTSTSFSSHALFCHLTQPSSSLKPSKELEKAEEEGEEILMKSFSAETSTLCTESDESSEEETSVEETDSMESSVTQTDDGIQDVDETMVVTEEEFPELHRENNETEEELKERKYHLLNAVCCSLVTKSKTPGQKGWKSKDSIWLRIQKFANEISTSDPEFILKVAVYTRQKLNIRITANFLLALAANIHTTKPHLRRYFCAAVQLPSDWLEVIRIYTACFKRSLPMCLKKAMADKFKDFSEYQLAKYNTRKQRCKHNCKKKEKKKPSPKQLKDWAAKVRSDASTLKKFLEAAGKKTSVSVVDKKQSEFSIKKMIKRFHIKEPAENIMALLGKKYPANQKSFTYSGLKGEWDRERAGKRMKLKEPQTWERLLSQEGNKAATWEKLIDEKSLPFMAMLRNLRNMIIKGISEQHHNKILKRLTDKKAVIESRQFPFRFLVAYKVIMEIRKLASATQVALPTAQETLKEILTKIPQSKRFSNQQWATTKKGRIKVALAVPYVYRMYKMKRAQLQKANQKLYTMDLLDRYCKALETSVQISCRNNLPPLPGRTVIMLTSQRSYYGSRTEKHDFCLPPDPEKTDKEEKKPRRKRERMSDEEPDDLSPSMQEVGVLLALMIHSSAEDCMICLTNNNHWEEVQLKSDVLLDNVRTVVKQSKAFDNVAYDKRDRNFFQRTYTKKNKVDNIILLNDSWVDNDIKWAINSYKKEINNKVLVVQIDLVDCGSYDLLSPGPNFVKLTGFSDQILRFVAERGSSRLLDHVEHMDKLFNVPAPKGEKQAQKTDSVLTIPASPKLRWRGVRVFISSTFRDMHSERDVLVRSVFPELRRRAAQYCLYLQEVELRWGVTEEESERATELCLSEVCRCDMLVGLLGERYGMVPSKPVLPDLPQYRWLDSAPAGLSITEMEVCQFQALHPDMAHQRMFFYVRDPNVIRSVPAAWKSDFSHESKEAQEKMSALKERLIDSGVKVTENYSCEWGGIVDGKPHLKNLDKFGNAVLEDLWLAVRKMFVDDADDLEAATEVREQEAHQEVLRRQFIGRSKLLSDAIDRVERSQDKGWITVVKGGSGHGKTVFMAALAEALKAGVQSKKHSVISYSTAASQSARSVQNLLRCLVLCLKDMTGTKKQTPLACSYKELLAEFHSLLKDEKICKPLVVLVDGVDLIQDGRGQLSCDWIPPQLPQGVCLVVSANPNSSLLQMLLEKQNAIPVCLGFLSMPDRKDIIQNKLAAFGKKLGDSAFNNQLFTLMMKKGAVSPFYLHLACEDLRSFASFDKLKDSVQDLPQSLIQLVQHSLERLCWNYRGMRGLRWALAVLTVSTTGVKEIDFYSVLNTCNTLSSKNELITWENVLQLSKKPEGRVPMAIFTRIVQSLQSLIGSSHCYNTDDLLTQTHPEVKQAFENFLLHDESDREKAHLVLAAHLWTRADPQGQDTFLHSEINSLVHLPLSLDYIGQKEALKFLLSSYYFLYANVRHGLLQHLMETYKLYGCLDDQLEDCHDFLRRHAVTLSSWPGLFIQEALGEPPVSPVYAWAQGMVKKGRTRLVECQNKNVWDVQEMSDMMSVFQTQPTCLALSPDEQLLVVGTGKGMLHIVDSQTGQELKSIVSSCDGISSCVFVTLDRLVSTSFDGRIEVWDVENGCRTALYDAHSNTITASNVTADKKHIATVSLDFSLKVWSSNKGQEVASHITTSPLNCVTFDPEGHLLAAGCWNGKVILWNWLRNKTLPMLSGHQRSVRCLSFSSISSMLCSGSVSGEVRVWSVPTSTCVGCFQAHSGATGTLTFLGKENMLLTAGSDHTLQLWSGGLGRLVTTFKSIKSEQEPPQKKPRSTQFEEPAALCVAVNGDCVAVGYHGDSIKIFNLESGEVIQTIEYVQLSILCLLWVVVDAPRSKREMLVASGSDKRLRVFKRKEGEEGMMGQLEDVGMFGHSGVVVAMAQNKTYLATASEDCTIVLWLLKTMARDVSMDPHLLLKGHTGGVTCLAFSPDGTQLLSGGKDRALMLWDVSSSPAALCKPLPHAHRDWVTDCVWTPSCVISSSNDGRLCLWDLEAGQCRREISWRSPPSSLCCLGQHVVAGCADGGLHVWNWETNVEISHKAAHNQRIHQCALLPEKDMKEVDAEELTVLTASDDGTVKIWKPLQMEHFITYQGHSGAIHGIVQKEEHKEFLTVSEDHSLRCWTWIKEYPANMKGNVRALSFSEDDDTFAAGYESGLLEVWQKNAVVSHKQVADSPITSVCSIGNNQYAVSYMKKVVVDVWKLVWNKQHTSRSLVKVTTYKVESTVVRLFYCSALLAVSHYGEIFGVSHEKYEKRWNYTINCWNDRVRILNVIRNDKKSAWLVGEEDGQVNIGFIFTLGSKSKFTSAFSLLVIESEEELKKEEEEEKGSEQEEEEGEKDKAETGQEEEEEEKKEEAEMDEEGEEKMEVEEEDDEQEDEDYEPEDEEEEDDEDYETEEEVDEEEEDDAQEQEEKDAQEQEEKDAQEQEEKDAQEQEEKDAQEEEEDEEEEDDPQEEEEKDAQEEEDKEIAEKEEVIAEEEEVIAEEEGKEEDDEEEEENENDANKRNQGSLITAITADQELVVCGDIEGNMWFNLPPKLMSWSQRKPAHAGRISQLRLTDTTIISASYDRTVKLWDRSTKKQLGMYVCGGPVLVLEVNPRKPTELLCGDGDGMVYVLSWRE